MTSKKVLISGGAGFIGSHLVRRLLADGKSVIVIDDFSEGRRENLPGGENLMVFEASVCDGVDFLFENVDTVFHLAALPRPQWSITHPEETHRVNVTGTLKTLLHCRDNNIRKVVFASSAFIYGEQEIQPMAETATPYLMCPYALHKLVGEQYCQLFSDLYGLQTISLRFFNVYGSRMNPDSPYSALIPKFIKMIDEGLPPLIHGDGQQLRDFVYIDDLVDGIILASQLDVGGVINLGYGKTRSVNDVHKIICDLLGTWVEPVHVDPVIEPRISHANREKAQELLGWVPKVDLEEGINRIINESVFISTL